VQYSGGSLEGTLDPGQYVLGAGDVLEIGFWGDVNRREIVTVNPDGDILITPVGPVRVDGLTLLDVRDIVRRALAPYYRPSILSVSLVSIWSFQIHVVGIVEAPGAVEVNSVTRVSQAIDLAGGLREGASLRNIVIRRSCDEVAVDLAHYILLGDNGVNPYLEGGDVVYVPPESGWLSIYGSVYRPGRYEMVEGETVLDLVTLAGGFRPEAHLESIEIQRFKVDDPTVSGQSFLDGDPDMLGNEPLEPGDRVFIRAIPGWHRDAKIEIKGEVMYPGIYVIEEGRETLSEVIGRAGGLTENASLAEAHLIRGYYSRTDFPIEAEIGATLDVESSLGEKDIDLLRTLSREPKGMVSIDFEDALLGGKDGTGPVLYDGDMIEIPRAVWYVRVAGHAKTPGLVAFKAGEDYRYYVKQAGGFAPGGDTRGTRLIRSLSGQRIKPGGQEIRPGDIVWIPRKKETDWWNVTKEVITVLAQIATIYVVADRVSSE
jgi:protein involved in polysaccharide export with SLBB domain